MNEDIQPVTSNWDELNDFELASIGTSYQKGYDIIPPAELAKSLGFGDNYIKNKMNYYEIERSKDVEKLFKNLINAKYDFERK